MRRLAIAAVFVGLGFVALERDVASQALTVRQLAPGVFFRQGDREKRQQANCGWVIFRDYVVVIDANFPWGARQILPEIKKTSNKPIRFVFDTHYHGDHAQGNSVFVDEGATIVSSADAAAESRARHEHAMSLFQRALDIGQRLADSDEADLHSQRELALYLNKIGNQHLTLGRPDEARDAYARSVAVRRALFASDPTPRHRRDLMQGLYKLGDVHRERALAGPPENREPELRAGLAFLEEARDLLTAPDARPIPTRTPDLTEVMNVLNKCRAALGMPEEAFPLLERP